MYPLLKNVKLHNRPKRSLTAVSKIPERAEAIKNNQTLYFTGKPCKYGHIAHRFTNNGTCKECFKVIAKKSYHKYYNERNFDISDAERQAIDDRQYGVCAICKEEETIIDGQTKEVKPLSLDHNHKTGKVRGLLCTKCNIGLGNFNDEAYLLRRAADYLEQ